LYQSEPIITDKRSQKCTLFTHRVETQFVIIAQTKIEA